MSSSPPPIGGDDDDEEDGRGHPGRVLAARLRLSVAVGGDAATDGTHGNYPGYYGYRWGSPVRIDGDSRLALLEAAWFDGRHVLDIGCHCGYLTLALAARFAVRSITGLDLDPALLARARDIAAAAAAVAAATDDDDDDSDGDGDTVPSGSGRLGPSDHRFVSALRTWPGWASAAARQRRLERVCFVWADVATAATVAALPDAALPDTAAARFETVCCFSVTKWIHLNSGDAGIQRLFEFVARALVNGGLLVLEVQPRATYRKARRLVGGTRTSVVATLDPVDGFPAAAAAAGLRLRPMAEGGGLPARAPHRHRGFRRPLMVFEKVAAAATSATVTS